MKIKKIVILVFLVLLSFLTVNTFSSIEQETNDSIIYIQEDELTNLNQSAMHDASALRFEGSGGYVGGTAEVCGGGALIALAYWAMPYFEKWLNSLFNNDSNNYIVESATLSIDDVLNHPDIQDGM